MASLKFLPAATKDHLYRLVTDSAYRSGASHASYDLGGPGSPGVPITKYGWEAYLPAGTEQRKKGQADPGKYRLAAYTKKPSNSVYWYKMEHVGGNSYKFEAITGFPACPICKGTGDHLCTDCNGTGRIVDGNFSSACTKCRNVNNPLRSGVITCACGSKHLANGVSVDTNPLMW